MMKYNYEKKCANGNMNYNVLLILELVPFMYSYVKWIIFNWHSILEKKVSWLYVIILLLLTLTFCYTLISADCNFYVCLSFLLKWMVMVLLLLVHLCRRRNNSWELKFEMKSGECTLSLILGNFLQTKKN